MLTQPFIVGDYLKCLFALVANHCGTMWNLHCRRTHYVAAQTVTSADQFVRIIQINFQGRFLQPKPSAAELLPSV